MERSLKKKTISAQAWKEGRVIRVFGGQEHSWKYEREGNKGENLISSTLVCLLGKKRGCYINCIICSVTSLYFFKLFHFRSPTATAKSLSQHSTNCFDSVYKPWELFFTPQRSLFLATEQIQILNDDTLPDFQVLPSVITENIFFEMIWLIWNDSLFSTFHTS